MEYESLVVLKEEEIEDLSRWVVELETLSAPGSGHRVSVPVLLSPGSMLSVTTHVTSDTGI